MIAPLNGIGQSGADARWHSEDASGSREPDASNAHGRPSRTAIEVGAALDMGAATYKRAKHVVQVARGEIEAAPEVQAAAVEALSGMNNTGNITGAYQKVRKARAAAQRPAGKTPAVRGRPSQRHVIKVTSLRKITERISGYQEAITTERNDPP